MSASFQLSSAALERIARHARCMRASADRRRERWLEKAGYRVVRVSAASVLHDVAAVVRVIGGALDGGA